MDKGRDDRSMNLTRSINFLAIMEAECSIPDSASGLPDSRGESIRSVPRALAGIRRVCVPRKLLSAEGNSRNDPGSVGERERGGGPPLVISRPLPRPLHSPRFAAFPLARLNYRRNAWWYRVAVNSVKASYVNKRMMLRANIPPRHARGCKCAVIRV